MPTVVNLSNEVVKMRSEVKKVKAFIIRKLTRHMTMLKKKKGKEEVVERNQRRAARLLEEIHEIKVLAPDTVTKAALQANISYEKVCQNRQASISERAIARIASHPQFNEKIQNIKNRLEAFTNERTNTAEKKEKISKADKTEVTPEKKDESPALRTDTQAMAEGEDVQIKAEDQGEKDHPSSEDCGTGTDQAVAPQTMPKEETVTPKEATTVNTTTVPVEVVRMRKDVKKIRVLIISKLTSQIDVLKRKKPEDPEAEANQQKIATLQKDIKALRSIQLDSATRVALQSDSSLGKVCEDPEASPAEKATARIATHPRFVKKLQAIREAIVEEQRKAAEAEEKRKRRLEQREDRGNEDEEGADDDDQEEEEEEEDGEGYVVPEVYFSDSDASDEEDDDDDDDDEEEEEEEEEEEDDDDEEDGEEEGPDDEKDEDGADKEDVSNVRPSTSQVEKVIKVMNEPVSITEPSDSVNKQVNVKPKPVGQSVVKVNQMGTSKPSPTVEVKHDVSKSPVKKTVTVSHALKNNPTSNQPSKEPKSHSKVRGTEDEDGESDLSDDEDKPYFDDSTEERFLKQSSASEESDDDFFVGKVSKFKKKKTPVAAAAAAVKKTHDATSSKDKDTEQDHTQQEETPNFKSDFKGSKFESVFCSTLSNSRGGSQRHNDRFGAKSHPRFQKQIRQPPQREREGGRQNQDFGPDRKWDSSSSSSFQHRKSDSSSSAWGQKERGSFGAGNSWGQRDKGSFGAGRGRQSFERGGRQQGHPRGGQNPQHQRGPPARTFNQPQQTAEVLHPSWEASKKRKEQMSQITAFQGKKIKFDDD